MKFINEYIHFSKKISQKMKDDSVSAYSAQVTLFIIISTFPFIMFLFTIIQYTPLTESAIISFIKDLAPTGISPILVRWISEIYKKTSGTIISITAITTLWSASRGFLSLLRGLNSVYNIKETRSYFKLRSLSALYTLIFTISIVFTLTLLVFGNSLYIWLHHRFPILDNVLLFIISFRVIAAIAILLFFFLMFFMAIPNRQSTMKAEFPGALFATFGWLGFSYLFSYYIDHFGNYAFLYGSLTSIVIFMLWLYFCMNLLFIGAEINVCLIKKRP